MLELMYREWFGGAELSEEPEEIQHLIGEVWNMALQSVNRQIILISYDQEVMK
jgi:hypothetical protein